MDTKNRRCEPTGSIIQVPYHLTYASKRQKGSAMYKLLIGLICVVVIALLVVLGAFPLVPAKLLINKVWAFMKKTCGRAKSYVSNKREACKYDDNGQHALI
jgi:uncharacterized membrane protein